MKLALTAFALIAATTAASAGQSDRYHDLRLDTAVAATDRASSQNDAGYNTDNRQPNTGKPNVAVTTRGKASNVPYAYANPYGVGPNNDSR